MICRGVKANSVGQTFWKCSGLLLAHLHESPRFAWLCDLTIAFGPVPPMAWLFGLFRDTVSSLWSGSSGEATYPVDPMGRWHVDPAYWKF